MLEWENDCYFRFSMTMSARISDISFFDVLTSTPTISD